MIKCAFLSDGVVLYFLSLLLLVAFMLTSGIDQIIRYIVTALWHFIWHLWSVLPSALPFEWPALLHFWIANLIFSVWSCLFLQVISYPDCSIFAILHVLFYFSILYLVDVLNRTFFDFCPSHIWFIVILVKSFISLLQ